MRIGAVGVGLLTLALSLSAVAPASAEFFGCKDQRGQVLYSYNGSPSNYGSHRSSRRSANHFAAQPHRRYQAHATYSHRTDRRQPDRWR